MSLGLRTEHYTRRCSFNITEKLDRREVIVLVGESDIDYSIQSTTRHVKPCGKQGGPPPKAKYYLMTDSEAVP